MSEIRQISFGEQSEEIKNRVQQYWTRRADFFFDLRHDEIESNKAERWVHEIERLTDRKKNLKILDVGCGAGFFEVLLAREGHDVTGIDLTDEMIRRAGQMLEVYEIDPSQGRVCRMDGEKPAFPDETFDVVISRNLTWTLPHPVEAYQEWYRVLKTGGVLLNFDAEYAKYAHNNLYSQENRSHSKVTKDMKDECHAIYHMLSISSLPRPQWDKLTLERIGFCDIQCDIGYGDRIYIEHDEFYMPDRMFSIKAVKGTEKS